MKKFINRIKRKIQFHWSFIKWRFSRKKEEVDSFIYEDD